MKVTEKKIEDGLIELTAAAATAEVAQAFNVAHYSFCASMGVEVPPMPAAARSQLNTPRAVSQPAIRPTRPSRPQAPRTR